MTAKPVQSLEDIKGMKLRVWAGEFQARFYEAMGAVAVPVPIMDYPDAMARGMIDGLIGHIPTFRDLGFLDPTAYVTYVEGKPEYYTSPLLLGGGHLIVMSQSVWAGLSDEACAPGPVSRQAVRGWPGSA